MQTPDYDAFFIAYVDFYNAALANKPVLHDLRACYAEYLVSASAQTVMGGENGDEYEKVLEKGFGFYRAIGVAAMRLRKVEVLEIIPGHDQARVFFTAQMRRRDGSGFPLDFEVVYLLQRRDSGPKIFAFLSEDEMELFRRLGLIDGEGKPVEA